MHVHTCTHTQTERETNRERDRDRGRQFSGSLIVRSEEVEKLRMV